MLVRAGTVADGGCELERVESHVARQTYEASGTTRLGTESACSSVRLAIVPTPYAVGTASRRPPSVCSYHLRSRLTPSRSAASSLARERRRWSAAT
jgi:hypothetical protein